MPQCCYALIFADYLREDAATPAPAAAAFAASDAAATAIRFRRRHEFSIFFRQAPSLTLSRRHAVSSARASHY